MVVRKLFAINRIISGLKVGLWWRGGGVSSPVPRVLQIDAKLNILMVKRKCNFATFQRIDDVST